MTSNPHDHPIRSLAGWLGLTFLTGVVGGLGSLDAPVFYAQLDKPTWAPPAAVFGPVWSVLYFLMGFAAWMVWRRRDRISVRTPLTFFVVQLLLNALWSWLFFSWRQGGAALAEVVVLWIFVAATVLSFWRVRRAAGIMLVPYFAWVSFASVLTASVWQRNPTLL